jgi:hypothetical protein
MGRSILCSAWQATFLQEGGRCPKGKRFWSWKYAPSCKFLCLWFIEGWIIGGVGWLMAWVLCSGCICWSCGLEGFWCSVPFTISTSRGRIISSCTCSCNRARSSSWASATWALSSPLTHRLPIVVLSIQSNFPPTSFHQALFRWRGLPHSSAYLVN